MRLDKFTSNALQITRSEAKKLIQKGKIKVYKDSSLINKVTSEYNITIEKVFYNDLELIYKENIYIMMNKPSGYVCSNFEKNNKTVFDLLQGYKVNDLGVVGRLDIDTEGLVIITSDGDLIHKITSPKNNHYKKYYCECENELSDSDIKLFNDRIVINDDGEEYKCKSAKLEIIDKKKCYIEISEGKFHQIKKMMKAISNNVTYLKRISIKNIELDPNLKLGEYRELTSDEVNLLLND